MPRRTASALNSHRTGAVEGDAKIAIISERPLLQQQFSFPIVGQATELTHGWALTRHGQTTLRRLVPQKIVEAEPAIILDTPDAILARVAYPAAIPIFATPYTLPCGVDT